MCVFNHGDVITDIPKGLQRIPLRFNYCVWLVSITVIAQNVFCS